MPYRQDGEARDELDRNPVGGSTPLLKGVGDLGATAGFEIANRD